MSDGPRSVGATVSIDRAALLLGVSRRTVYYWIANGRLVTVRTANGWSQRVLVESTAFHRLHAGEPDGN